MHIDKDSSLPEPHPGSPPQPKQDSNPSSIVPVKKRYLVPLKKRFGVHSKAASSSAPVEEASTSPSEQATSSTAEHNLGKQEVPSHYTCSMTKGLVLGEEQRHKARKLVNQVHASDPTFVAVLSSTPVEEADTNSIEQATSLAAENNLEQLVSQVQVSHPTFIAASSSAPVKEANAEQATSFSAENNLEEAPSLDAYSTTKGLVLNEEQRHNAQQLVSQVQASNPTFLQVLRRSHLMINAGVAIPRRFCDKNPTKNSQYILLRRYMEEKTWSAWYYHYGERQRTISHAGWRKFVKENKLKQGDTCLFELDKSAKGVAFIVHVSHAT